MMHIEKDTEKDFSYFSKVVLNIEASALMMEEKRPPKPIFLKPIDKHTIRSTEVQGIN